MKLFSGDSEIERKEKLVESVLLDNYNSYYRLAYSYVHNDADAADIVQNGAYRAIKYSHSLKNESYVTTWVYRIMLNEIFRMCRKENDNVISLEEMKEHGEDEGREDTYHDFDLQKAVDGLEPKEKAVVELRYFEDKKLDEIADILGMNVSTVKSKLYRSMKKLKLLLE